VKYVCLFFILMFSSYAIEDFSISLKSGGKIEIKDFLQGYECTGDTKTCLRFYRKGIDDKGIILYKNLIGNELSLGKDKELRYLVLDKKWIFNSLEIPRSTVIWFENGIVSLIRFNSNPSNSFVVVNNRKYLFLNKEIRFWPSGVPKAIILKQDTSFPINSDNRKSEVRKKGTVVRFDDKGNLLPIKYDFDKLDNSLFEEPVSLFDRVAHHGIVKEGHKFKLHGYTFHGGDKLFFYKPRHEEGKRKKNETYVHTAYIKKGNAFPFIDKSVGGTVTFCLDNYTADDDKRVTLFRVLPVEENQNLSPWVEGDCQSYMEEGGSYEPYEKKEPFFNKSHEEVRKHFKDLSGKK